MKIDINVNSINKTLYFHIRKESDGTPLTGLTFDSVNLQAYYNRDLEVPVVISLVTQTVTGAHTDGGFVEVNAVQCPGLYRLDVPDAAFVTGGTGVRVYLSEVTTTALDIGVSPAEIQLSTYEKSDPVSTNRLPNIDEIDSPTDIATATRVEMDDNSTQLAAIVLDTGTTLPGEHALLATEAKQDIIDSNVDAVLVDTSTTLPAEHALLATEAKQDIIDSNVDAILEDTSTTIPDQISALNDITVSEIIAGITDGTYDLQEMLRLICSAVAGKTSSGGLIMRDLNDTKNRLTYTIDLSNNRTSVVKDAT